MTYMTEEKFSWHLRGMAAAPELTVDTEGTLNHPHSTTWGLSTSARGVAEYFAFNHQFGENLPMSWFPKLKAVIENHPCLVFHNAKHDLRSLMSMGIDYRGKFYDTMLMQHMIDENVYSKGLDTLSKLHGGQPKMMPELAKSIIDGFGWSYIPADLMRSYAANDAFITEELFIKLLPEFQSQGFNGELWDVEQKFVRLMMKIENQGILIDKDLCERELERGLEVMKGLKAELGFNPNSPQQLKKFLVDELGLPIVKRNKKTQSPSFDKEAMEIYDAILQGRNDPRAQKVLTYRGWMKTTSSNYASYLELVCDCGRLHPNFKIHGTRTGRMSCEKPNLQQIPRNSENDWNGKLKQAFTTECGRTAWESDYSQLEFRLAASYGKVQKLIDIFNDPTRDVFDEITIDMGFTERQRTKVLVYTVQYGGGANRIHQVFSVGLPEARTIIANFYKNYPGLARISRRAKELCEERGYIQYWTGRRRHLDRWDAHKAFNALDQGGSAEIVKRRMIAVDDAGLNNKECAIDLQVHDSIRMDIENGKEQEYLPEIERILSDVDERFGVRFAVDTNKWGTKEQFIAA